jgi:E3 ubiquitin-protein ligase MYCBP2
LFLGCTHTYHAGCVRQLLENKWVGARITFGFMQCPLCKKDMQHPYTKDLMDVFTELLEDVQRKCLVRVKYEGLEEHADIITPGSPYFNDPLGFAMHKFAYYQCFKCQKPYYGGDYACAAAGGGGNFDASELMCGGCSPISSEECPKHGKDFLEFKCRFCCSIAVWFCFGTTHFCEPCHNNNGALCGKTSVDLLQCPCKATGRMGMPEKVEGDCPLDIDHPPHGEEFALGCGICRNAAKF